MIKNKIISFLIKLLDKDYLEHFLITSDAVSFGIKDLVPKDGKWHQVKISVSFIMRNGKNKWSNVNDLSMQVDGKNNL